MDSVKRVFGALLLVASLPVIWFGWKFPMEAGGLVFGPVLIGAGLVLLLGAISLLSPKKARPQRRPWLR